MKNFYSNGKLLISAEYLVLDGALSLALPTKYGQSLSVETNDLGVIYWASYNVMEECWFKAKLSLENFELIDHNNLKIATTLQAILRTAKNLNSAFLKTSKGLNVKTALTFPNEWGLGTSSTLINNVAQWAEVNAFELLEKSFGGSGYDIACAQNNTSITYKRSGINPLVNNVSFNPIFKENIFFVYLNQKQDSKEGIKMYRSLKVEKSVLIERVNTITKKMIDAKKLQEFEILVENHETMLSELLNIAPVKQKLFADFTGTVKSLGAWGGDFVMVTGVLPDVYNYFNNKGYTTILNYSEMILD